VTVVRRDQLRTMMGMVLLSDIGFRSLDFSELALRVEQELGPELNFDAPGLRAVKTVGGVLDLFGFDCVVRCRAVGTRGSSACR